MHATSLRCTKCNSRYATKSCEHSTSNSSAHLQSSGIPTGNGRSTWDFRYDGASVRFSRRVPSSRFQNDETLQRELQDRGQGWSMAGKSLYILGCAFQSTAPLKFSDKQGSEPRIFCTTSNNEGDKTMNENNNAIMMLPLDNESSKSDKVNRLQNYNNGLEFIKAGLNMTDEELATKRVNELSELMIKAQKKITVGSMQTLLKKNEVKIGVFEGLFLRVSGWFSWMFKDPKKKSSIYN